MFANQYQLYVADIAEN